MAAKYIPQPIPPGVRGLIGHRRAKESVQEGSLDVKSLGAEDVGVFRI